MKSIEIPDRLFTEATAAADAGGLSLEDFLAAAVQARVQPEAARKSWPVLPPKVDKAESQKIAAGLQRVGW